MAKRTARTILFVLANSEWAPLVLFQEPLLPHVNVAQPYKETTPPTPCANESAAWLHYRHDIITAAIRNATSRAGLSSTREPLYAELDRDNTEAGRARGDIYTILTPGPGPTAVDTVVTHPGTATNITRNIAHTIYFVFILRHSRRSCSQAENL
jgi:hypothetical protein